MRSHFSSTIISRNGKRVRFRMFVNGDCRSFRVATGSPNILDVEALLFRFTWLRGWKDDVEVVLDEDGQETYEVNSFEGL